MKVTKEKAAKNRATLVQAAGRLFRERGIDGVGVAEICQAAGLTHGALYAQFPSKEALAAEALAAGLDRSYAYMTAGKDEQPPGLTEYLDLYLSRRLRDNLAGGCPMAARSEEHTSELQSPCNLVCRLLLEKKKQTIPSRRTHVFTCSCGRPGPSYPFSLSAEPPGRITSSPLRALSRPRLKRRIT